jgi:hypothetical protein
MGREGHPLPASDESRHGEIPEDKIEEKGFGDDDAALVQPAAEPVNPDGEPYRYDDNGRAGDVGTGEGGGTETLGPGTPA